MSSPVDRLFQTVRKSHMQGIANARDEIVEQERSFADYIATGKPSEELLVKIEPVDPPLQPWELTQINIVGRCRSSSLALMDLKALRDEPLDLQLAANSLFCAGVLLGAKFRAYRLFERRFGRKGGIRNLMAVTLQIALAFVLGRDQQARDLLRLFDAQIRLGDVNAPDGWPLFRFMLALIQEHYGFPPLAVRMLEEDRLPQVEALFDQRFAPDPNDLTLLCLEVCNLHLERAKPIRREFREYVYGELTLTPIEVMVLFRIRTQKGLVNPELDHPMFRTGLGKLVREPLGDWPEPAPLLIEYRAKLARDGFGEADVETLLREAGY